MKRLLTTVAFSALVLGVAASGWAQGTTGTTSPSTGVTPQSTTGMGTTGKTTTSDAAGKPTRNGSPTLSNKSDSTMSSSSSSSDQTTTKTKRKHVSQKTSRATGADRSADELNRQELARMSSGTGASSSYGSSGTTAPSSSGMSK